MNKAKAAKVEVNYFSLVFFLTLIFGVFFNEFIGFGPIDEMLQIAFLMLFLIFSFWKGELEMGRVGWYVLGAFIFYTFYSFRIGSNTTRAILLDIILQSKPFIAFLVVYYSRQRLSHAEKNCCFNLVWDKHSYYAVCINSLCPRQRFKLVFWT